MKTVKCSVDWKTWWKELKRIAREQYGELSEQDASAWRMYYADGLSPQAALTEDLSYA